MNPVVDPSPVNVFLFKPDAASTVTAATLITSILLVPVCGAVEKVTTLPAIL